VYKFWNKLKNKINHGFALFELIEFLLSTNAKVERMMAVSAVMFEIVEMYIFQIHLHYFFCMLHVKAKP
jgi:hypothetical protein